MITPINGVKITALQRSLSAQGMSAVKVVPPGFAQNLTGIDSLKRLPNLHQELTDLIRTKFGIEVNDILCDREAKIEILSCDPPFMERVRNANGNPGVLGHIVVIEMENDNLGKLYLLRNENNVASIIDREKMLAKTEATALPVRALTWLKGVISIESFAFGKDTLKPAMIEPFKKDGIEIGEILLDQAAKVKLTGMMPSFKDRIARGETAEEIFPNLELSLLSAGTEAGPNLYILGDKTNIAKASDPFLNEPLTAETLDGLSKDKTKPAEVRPKIEAIDWPQRMYDSDAKSIAANILFEPSRFASVSLPDSPLDKLLFLFSALELWKVSWVTIPINRNHILAEIGRLYESINDSSQKQNLADIGITCALQLLERDRSDQWAGIISLAGIPIPTGHPKLPEISRKLAQIITASEHWPNVKAAAEVALKIKDSFPEPERALIKSAAEQMAKVYSVSSRSYGIDMMFDAQKQTNEIAALLEKIINDFGATK